MVEVKSIAEAAAHVENLETKEPKKKPGPAPKKKSFEVLVRHSAFPVKSATLEASNEHDAFDQFCELNKTTAAEMVKEAMKKRTGFVHPIEEQVKEFLEKKQEYDLKITEK